MEPKEIKILEKAVRLFKDYEHGKLKEISGKEIDIFLKESLDYHKKMKEMRKKLEEKLMEHDAEKIDNDIFDLLKTIFGSKSKEALIKDFDSQLVKKGKMKKRLLPALQEVSKIRQKIKSGKVSQVEMDLVKRGATDLMNELIDYMQRKDIMMTERSVIQISFGDQKDKKGELVLTDPTAFFVESGRIMKIDGEQFDIATRQELEEAIKNSKDISKLKLDSNVFNTLKKELGDFEINI